MGPLPGAFPRARTGLTPCGRPQAPGATLLGPRECSKRNPVAQGAENGLAVLGHPPAGQVGIAHPHPNEDPGRECPGQRCAGAGFSAANAGAGGGRGLGAPCPCGHPARPQPGQPSPQGLLAPLRLGDVWVRQDLPWVRTPGSVFILKETLAVVTVTMIVADDRLANVSNSSDPAQAPQQGDVGHFSYLGGKGPRRSQRPCLAWEPLAKGGPRRAAPAKPRPNGTSSRGAAPPWRQRRAGPRCHPRGPRVHGPVRGVRRPVRRPPTPQTQQLPAVSASAEQGSRRDGGGRVLGFVSALLGAHVWTLFPSEFSRN